MIRNILDMKKIKALYMGALIFLYDGHVMHLW